MAGAFHPFGANHDAVAESQGLGHGSHRFGFASHGIHQGQFRTGQSNRHRQARETTAGADINTASPCAGGRQLRQQWPEAVQHLGNPEILPSHKPGEIDTTVPLLKLPLQVNQLPELLAVWGPSQDRPQLGPRGGERR